MRTFLRPATSGGATTGACTVTERGGRRDRLAIRRGAAKTRLITVCVLRFVLPFCGDTLRGTPWAIGSGGWQWGGPLPRRQSCFSGKPGDQASNYGRTALQRFAMLLRHG